MTAAKGDPLGASYAAPLRYLRSTPPGEDATPDQLVRLERAVDRRFEAGGGTFVITKDVGAFACRAPRR